MKRKKQLALKKMHQILTEIDKNTKNQILKILCSFCVILESFGGFEFQRRSTRNEYVVREAFLRKHTNFCIETNAQFATKNDNNFKVFRFFTFSCNFYQVSKDFMDPNVKYLQPRKISWSNRVVCGDKCSFFKKKNCHKDPKIVLDFLHFCILQRNFCKSFNLFMD